MSTNQELFRAEALEHSRKPRMEGAVLRITSSWTRGTYYLLVWAVAAALVYCVCGTVREYARGVAVIEVLGRTQVTAHVEGAIVAVQARPGDRVRRGDVLVRIYDDTQRAELERVERDRRTAILRVLRAPAEPQAHVSVGDLQAQHQVALAALERHTIKAPLDGTVTDLRVREGQVVRAGDCLATITGRGSAGRVLAFVPAQYRPKIEAGMPLRLELQGFRFAYRELRVQSVGDEAVGPAEIRRYLGPERGDAISAVGPAVVVQATIPSLEFEAGGDRFSYYDGMVGRVDVRLRSEPIAVAMIPGLSDLMRSWR